MSELRRSPRLLVRIPVRLASAGHSSVEHTAVISPCGALVLCAQNWPLNTVLQIENPKTGLACDCRVVWFGGEDRPGLYKIGVEFLDGADQFWGEDYPADSDLAAE